MRCRLCNTSIQNQVACTLEVPSGTQLFCEDADSALALKTRINIVECQKCALIQLLSEPVVYNDIPSSSSFVSTGLTEHRRVQLQELFKVSGRPASKGSLLEIGCGDGHLLGVASDLFERVVGVEPTQRNADMAASNGLEVYRMVMAADAAVPGAPFDYFCCFHVLEHVSDICSVLEGIYNALVHNAIGVIEVPATEAAIENKRFGDFMPDHLNYFTESTLRLALQWNGFVIERIYRDWDGEHLVAYVRKRSEGSSVTFINERQRALDELIQTVTERQVPFVMWGISHHLLPYISTLARIPNLSVVDASPSKINKFIPSTSLRVHPIDILEKLTHGYIAISAPRFHREIRKSLGEKFQFVEKNADLTQLMGFSIYECKKRSLP